jgi:CheY-like chemotaxis protein
MASSPGTPRLLVVEHDPDLSAVLAALLRDEGCGVICASSLPQALTLAEEQVFHGAFTALFPHGHQEPLLSVEPLRLLTQPTPIVLLSGSFVEEAEAQLRGYASVLELPFRIKDVLQVLACHINRPFSPAQDRQVQLITAYLDALAEEDWERVRHLCLPFVQYVHLTPSSLSPTPALEGIDRLLAYAQAARQRLPGYRIEHRVVFEQRGLLVARYGCSWQGREGHRLALAGSVVFRCAGERIAQIGVSVNPYRMHTLLAHTATG